MPNRPSWGTTPQPEPPGGSQPSAQAAPSPTGGWGRGDAPARPSWSSLGQAPAWLPGPSAAAPLGPPGGAALKGNLLPPSTAPAGARPQGGHFRGWLAVASAVLLAGAGTSTSVVLAATGGSGAPSPAAAVQDLIGALNNSDVIGMLDAVDPGERNALQPGLEGIFGQLKRLGVLSSTADLKAVTGVNVSLHGLATSTDQLSADVAAVTVSGGTNTEAIDPSNLPLGSYFKRLADKALSGRSVSTSGPNRGNTALGTVRVGGRWYVSLGYTVAIDALRAAGRNPAPPATGQLKAAGASSAQGAVRALFTDASQLNLSALVADLDPAEMAAADAYSPDWLPNAQRALDKARGTFSIKFGNFSFTSQKANGGTLVKVGHGLTLSVKGQGMQLEYANGCYTYTVNGTTRHQCAQGGDRFLAQMKALLPPPVRPIFARLTTMKPDVGFVTVDQGGKWYVSPTRTYLEAVSAFLSELQPGDVQTIINNASGIGSAFEKYLQQQLPSALQGNGSPGLALPS